MERKGSINYFLDSPPPTPPFGLLFPTHLPQHHAVSSWELAVGLGFCKWPHLVLNFCFPSAFGKHCCIFNKSIYLWYNWWAFHFFFPVLYWDCFILRNKETWFPLHKVSLVPAAIHKKNSVIYFLLHPHLGSINLFLWPLFLVCKISFFLFSPLYFWSLL